MATGKYIDYAERLITSARKYFFTEDKVIYYVFTDSELKNPAPDIVRIEQKKMGWPYDTLMRGHIYAQHKELMKECDFLYALDADMLFVNAVGREILGERVATLHPGFLNQRGTYETNPKSTAYVSKKKGKYYFAGGFYGGNFDNFFSMLDIINKRIDEDLKKPYIAIWHDESHLNRFFIDYPPTTILSASYCYPESWNLPFQKRLLALDKNHHEMRS